MKKKLLFLLIIISQISFAQIPQSFKYQAVVRDAGGVLLVNKIISVRTSILAGSSTGSSVFTETQTLSTNEYGVVALNIGAGTLVSGNFSTINWGTTTYFVKTELDINGGSTYVFMGTSQILSVPYALYAERTGSSLSDHDTSATNELQTLSISGKNLSISNGNTIVLPQDSLSIAGYTIGITDGNTVNLPPPQTISIVGDSLHISNANSIYLSGSIDLDASPTNELQNLTLNNDTLKISMGNNVVFPHDVDRDSLNEIQNLSIIGNVISISKANSITLSDNNPTNELQTLTVTADSIKLSNGGGAFKIPTPTNSIVPQNNCINSINITPPNGYSFSSNNFLTRNEKWDVLKDTIITSFQGWGECVLNNKIYCIGGYDGINRGYNLVYNPVSNSWQSKTNMPTARRGPLLGIANNKIYAIGDASNAKNNEEYDPAINIWTIKSDAPAYISCIYSSLISYNNKIYIFGGFSGGAHHAFVYVYDPPNNVWTTYPLPSARKNIKTILFNNLIYLIGGSDGSGDVKTVETFNPVNNTSTSIASLNTIKGNTIDAFILNSALYVVGSSAIMEQYNLGNNTWGISPDFTFSLDMPGYNASNFIVQNDQVFLITSHFPQLFDFGNINHTNLKDLNTSIGSDLHSVFNINGKYYLTGNTYGAANGIKAFEFKLPSVYYIHCAN